MSSFPSLISFGALATWPAPDQLDQLRDSLQQNPSLKPLIETLQDLPLVWRALAAREQSLDTANNKSAADLLSAWAKGTESGQIVEERRNALTMPMSIISQILQYISYLRQHGGASHQGSILESVAAGGGIQGFCAGLLSAVAVAGAKNEEEIGVFAGHSVRLAFCIGVYIDLDQLRNGDDSRTSTLAVRWKSPTTLENIQRILLNHPEAYIAVIRDVRDATITTPTSTVAALFQDLGANDVSVLDTRLSGKYHSGVHEDVPVKILDACRQISPLNFGNQNLVRSNADGRLFSNDDIAQTVLKCILINQSNWYSTISTAASSLAQIPDNPHILSIGVDAVPQSITKTFQVNKVVANSKNISDVAETATYPLDSSTSNLVNGVYPDDAIAVVGMGCKFPGADSIDEFWDLLTGGKSMLQQIPEERFSRKNLPRSSGDLKFWGNFVSDIDAFDHKFFKKSSREAASTDPQQRLLLQVAYEALESSGYFASSLKARDIGCYLGSCSTDYDHNVGSHPPTAYSTTGTLRAFLSGKISHYFGWTGPSLTFDTACSSSAVAIHTACTALRMGECSQAMAGGVTLLTSPYLYENLATAHFLSPSGATKPFDASADGYCRGEGVGLVILKKLSDALTEGDAILGVIAGSAINQNNNCVPITVPHSSSQGELYQKVADQAKVAPGKVNFVEAHGTGTPVGDPIEMESIRNVFGGQTRKSQLFVSSVKGNIGHLEGASGVAALIKAILQMEYRIACTQASFKRLNPKIPALEKDKICIPTSNQELPKEGLLTALVNNYGAAGSNSAIMLIEGPRRKSNNSPNLEPRTAEKYPIRLAAASEASLLGYCKSLHKFCQTSFSSLSTAQQSRLLPNLAFSLARRQNQDLAQMLTLTAKDINDLLCQLDRQTATNNSINQKPKEAPVVLCFGGQVRDYVGLNKRVWEQSSLLRFRLDECDETLRTLGFPGIYPTIFQAQTVTDVVVLQSMIFSVQYACAQAWLDSGLKVDAIVGHSLGQLTALCMSGMLSLRDGLKLVAGRASLMSEHWGPEPGSMIAIEADEQTIEELITDVTAANSSLSYEVACYNGPTSQVIVSNKASADEMEAHLVKQSIRHRRLKVSYGFHSQFTEPLLAPLEKLASSLAFHEATIPLETCTNNVSWQKPTAQLVASHTRDPVFFGQAVQRLQSRLGACTWLEAGADSSVTGMVRRALGQSSQDPQNNFIPVELSKPSSLELLVDTTVDLWKRGHQVQYMNFHRKQINDYELLRLPSYEWEKPKHWLELITAPPANTNLAVPSSQKDATITAPPLPVLIRNVGTDSQGVHFNIDPRSEEYQGLIKGTVVSGIAVSAATVYVEVASRGVQTIGEPKANVLLSVQDLQIGSPLGLDLDREIMMLVRPMSDAWMFKISSKPLSSGDSNYTIHASGVIYQETMCKRLHEEFSLYGRLMGHEKVASIWNEATSGSIQGAMVYKLFSPITEYAHYHRGVKGVAAKETQISGKVMIPQEGPDCLKDLITYPTIVDCFLQVASLYANCIYESQKNEAFRLAKADRIQFGPDFQLHHGEVGQKTSWDVLAFASEASGDMAVDLFVYDANTRRIVLFIMGARFVGCDRTSTAKAQISVDEATFDLTPAPKKTDITGTTAITEKQGQRDVAQASAKPVTNQGSPGKDAKTSIYDDICVLLEKLADVPKDEVAHNASFDDLGVDSLMMIEVINELSTLFHIDLPIEDLENLTDIDSLVDYLHGRGVVGSTYSEASGPSDVPASMSTSASSSGTSAILTPSTSASDNGAVLVASSEVGKPVNTESPLDAQQIFDSVRFDFDKHAEQTQFKEFWTAVYPQQSELVDAYIVEAFGNLECDLKKLSDGERLPPVNGVLPKHGHLMNRLRKILVDSGLIEFQKDQTYVRTAKAINPTPAADLFQQMLDRYPWHTSETMLVNATGSQFTECLTGKVEPLSLLFANKVNRDIMAEVYANAPMCQATNRLLADFLSRTCSASSSDRVLRILEVGAGTGGTARYLVDFLKNQGVKFEYTFTDISSSLVNAAKKKFAGKDELKFMTLNCDIPAPPELCNKFDVVIATNIIHATPNATTSSRNIEPLLRDDGVFCLVEFTRDVYWFDLVYGLLEGWWLFGDGRQHALGDEWFWDNSLRSAGFKHVSWTDGPTKEAQTMRLICGFKRDAEKESYRPAGPTLIKRAGIPMETFVWKRVGNLDLSVDVYQPKIADEESREKRPIALMVHGGGHLLFGRKDIPMKHVRVLLQRGFLPVSVDYRLCPEVNLFDGPVTDVCESLQWVREKLPWLRLSGPKCRVDPDKVIGLGWSSGGQLAMSLGYTAAPRGIKPPDAILAFYSPTDLESDHWDKPCYPAAAEEEPTEIWGMLDGVLDEPIIEYTPISDKRTTALSLTLKDDRARQILHMNWKAQSVPVLVHGLPNKKSLPPNDTTDWKSLPKPPVEKIRQCSPYWHVLQGNYRTPTVMVHGNCDDWIPYQMSQKTMEALEAQGVPAWMEIPDGCGHAFDLFPVEDRKGLGWKAVEKGYDFVCGQLGM